MLNKSWRGAFIISAIGVAAFTLTAAVLNQLIPYLTGEASQTNGPGLGGSLEWLIGAAVLLIVLALLVTILAYWLHRYFGEGYFGRRGAARWALFGAMLALIVKLPDWIPLPGGWIVHYLFLFAGLFLAFFAARLLIPIKRPRGWRRVTPR